MKKTLFGFIFSVLTVLILIYNPLSVRLMAVGIARHYHLNGTYFYRLIKTESTFRGLAISQQQAIGPGQVRQDTAHYLFPHHQDIYLFFPLYNLKVSAVYLRYLLDKYDQNWSLALAAYNWGETNVDRKINGVSIQTNVNYRMMFENVRETNNLLRIVLRK